MNFESDPPSSRIATGLAKIGLALRMRTQEGAGRRGLSPTQSQVLANLLSGERGGRAGPRLQELADALGITTATTSDALSALESKGLVRKERDPADSRALRVKLTAKGRREAELCLSWPDFLSSSIDVLDETEKGTLVRALTKMISTLQKRGEIPISRMCATCKYFRPHAYAGTSLPHHCDFVDAPFGDVQLRFDCADHDPAPSQSQDELFALFVGGPKNLNP